MDRVNELLERQFGHKAFRPGQEKIIRCLLQDRSALAIFPTGGGKSICYQLPALLLEGLTLVISPLVALMKDQVDMLRRKNIAAARIDSSLPLPEVQSVYEQMRSGTLKLLYIAPERLVNEKFVERLQRTPLALMAVDEAHCISEWGHNFRPEYLRLSRVAQTLRIPRVLALTATATPSVAEDICKGFRIAPEDVVQTSFHRENLALHITPVSAAARGELLLHRLSDAQTRPAIVYVTLQETAESVAAALVRGGVHAQAYHAGLADDIRSRVQEDFMNGRVEVVVATIAFGMGIDKADIRGVYHFNLPKTLENYQQEIGRAGRDGKSARCEMLACKDDLTVLRNFTLGDTPTESALRQLVDHLLRQGEEFEISRYDLSRTTDIRPLVLETVLTHLEHDGLVEPIGAFYSSYKIAFERPESAILAGHTAERQRLLRTVFASGTRGRKWTDIDADTAAEAAGVARERVLTALNWLEEAGDIVVKPSRVRHRFRLLVSAGTVRPHDVASRLVALFYSREQQDIARLQTVVELAESEGCITRRLMHYFGEDLGRDCGHCGYCEGSMAVGPLPETEPAGIAQDDLKAIQRLVKEGHPALRTPRQLARFLCGINSPATLRDRLTRHDEFARLQRVDFRDVLAQCESLPL